MGSVFIGHLLPMPWSCWSTSRRKYRPLTAPGPAIHENRAPEARAWADVVVETAFGMITPEDKRHGTTTLFAALTVRTGEVTGQHMARHRQQEFIAVLHRIARDIPKGKAIQVIRATSAGHKHPNVRAWRACHKLKHGIFRSGRKRETAIIRFIENHNHSEAKPCTWRADPNDIIAARNRGDQMLDSIHCRPLRHCPARIWALSRPALRRMQACWRWRSTH